MTGRCQQTRLSCPSWRVWARRWITFQVLIYIQRENTWKRLQDQLSPLRMLTCYVNPIKCLPDTKGAWREFGPMTCAIAQHSGVQAVSEMLKYERLRNELQYYEVYEISYKIIFQWRIWETNWSHMFCTILSMKSWLFQASIRNCLNCVRNCDDHSSLDT